MDRPSWSRLTRPYLHRSGSPGDSGTGTRRTLGLLCEVDSGVRRQGMPPTLVPRPHPGKGGLRGHPRQALPSHPRTPRAGKSQFQGPLSPRAHGPDLRTGPRSAFRPAPAAQCVCAGAGGGGVVRSSSSPTTAWGGGGEPHGGGGRAPAGRTPRGLGRGQRWPRRSARRTHRTLAATEDMASLLSALLREATAPMVEAAAHPQASERAPRPPPPSGEPRRAGAGAGAGARTRNPHGRSGPSARPAAPDGAARPGGGAPPTVTSRSGRGSAGPPTATPRRASEAAPTVASAREDPEGTRLKLRPPGRAGPGAGWGGRGRLAHRPGTAASGPLATPCRDPRPRSGPADKPPFLYKGTPGTIS